MNSDIFTEYIEMNIHLGRRLKQCKIGINNLSSTPVLYIKSYKVPFFGMVSMLNGSYYAYDRLNDKESKLLYDFLSKSPNDHDGGNCEYGNCTNWLFILIQYLCDYKEKNTELDFIINNIRKYDDTKLVPRFDINASKYLEIPSVDQWSKDNYKRITKENLI